MRRKESVSAAAYSYTVLLQPEPEGGYTVTCPALPGLVTYGENLDEARAMAADAIRGYIECLREDDEPIPESDPIAGTAGRALEVHQRGCEYKSRESPQRSPANFVGLDASLLCTREAFPVDAPTSRINQSSRFMDLATHEDFRLGNCPIHKIGTHHHPQRSMISIDRGWRCGDRRCRGPRTSPRMRQSKTILRHRCAIEQCKMRQWCRMLKSFLRSIQCQEAADFHRLLTAEGWRLCRSEWKHASERVYPGA